MALHRLTAAEEIAFGEGSQLRDLMYASDAIDAFLATGLTDGTLGKALNVGGLEPVSLLDVAQLCQEVAAEGGALDTAPWPPEREKIDIGSICVDHSRLTHLTGWEPRFDLREGLARTFAFCREHGAHQWS
jgi:UDP-glucose 4-epimerase